MFKEELALAKDLALRAGSIIVKSFESPHDIHIKSDGTPVTSADLEINSLVLQVLSEKSAYSVISEEKSNTHYGDSDIFWICDPVDGTKALIDGTPTSMFSLALIEKSRPVLAVAYDPFLRSLYCATKGGGSFCNDFKLKVSSRQLEHQSVGIASDARQILENTRIIQALVNANVSHTTSIEGAVYKSCLVAKGRLVGYVSDRAKIHDVAAASLIVEEAGGQTSGQDGSRLDFSRPFSGFIASNGVVHDELVRICRS